MSSATLIKNAFHRWLGEPLPQQNPKLNADPGIMHIGRRSYCRKIGSGEDTRIKKVFTTRSAGRQAFASELLAHRLFRDENWMPRWQSRGIHSYTRMLYPQSSRLDRIAPKLDNEQRLAVAGDVLSIALDLYCAGFAHRDFHAGNIYYLDSTLKLTDYETLAAYEENKCPAFWSSYDITGRGMESPYMTGNMGFAADSEMALANVLNVSLDEARVALGNKLKIELKDASLSFQTRRDGTRHELRTGRTYSTFEHQDLAIGPAEAQRDCRRRFSRFGIHSDALTDKTILDLGSNIGGMSAFAQHYHPAQTVGIEYDADKVRVARRMAAFCGYTRLRYLQGDIDKMTVRLLGGPYDIVFCLAISAHVQNPDRLYGLLGKVTRETLYFEGNAGTDCGKVEAQLRKNGFKSIEQLGMCDDDSLPENNCRPLLRATK